MPESRPAAWKLGPEIGPQRQRTRPNSWDRIALPRRDPPPWTPSGWTS